MTNMIMNLPFRQNPDLPNFPFTSIPLPATTPNGRVAGLVVSPFRFSKISPKSLTSNPLSQIATSNLRLQPDTHFAVDMFPYKKTELFQMSGLTSQLPKKPGNLCFFICLTPRCSASTNCKLPEWPGRDVFSDGLPVMGCIRAVEIIPAAQKSQIEMHSTGRNNPCGAKESDRDAFSRAK